MFFGIQTHSARRGKEKLAHKGTPEKKETERLTSPPACLARSPCRGPFNPDLYMPHLVELLLQVSHLGGLQCPCHHSQRHALLSFVAQTHGGPAQGGEGRDERGGGGEIKTTRGLTSAASAFREKLKLQRFLLGTSMYVHSPTRPALAYAHGHAC